MSEPSPAIPAATLVVFRRSPDGGPPQLLMVERSAAMAFAGGATVFPGGRVDPADHALASRIGALGRDDLEDLAGRIAAIRETLEETGLMLGISQRIDAAAAAEARARLLRSGDLGSVIDELGWALDPGLLLPFARWRPDHAGMRNFDTRFYLADLGTGAVELAVDETENTHLFWATAEEALARADQDRIRIIYPTRRNLERLAQFADFAAAREHVLAIPPRTITPFAADRDGVRHLCIPDDAGYPITSEPLESADRV